MKKWLQKILLLIAVITVTGHSILPHFHHDDVYPIAKEHHNHDSHPANHHDHDDDNGKEDQHSLFSFAQLDEDFLPVKTQNHSVDIPFEYLATSIITFNRVNLPVNTTTPFGCYQEFPPPGNLFVNLPSRAPPASLFS
jgi:hypothetical protein